MFLEVTHMSRTKIMVSIPEELLTEIDRTAQEEHRSRSEFFREAVRLYLQVRKARSIPGQDPRVQQAVAIQDALAHQDTLKDWNGIVEIRRWREKR